MFPNWLAFRYKYIDILDPYLFFLLHYENTKYMYNFFLYMLC